METTSNQHESKYVIFAIHRVISFDLLMPTNFLSYQALIKNEDYLFLLLEIITIEYFYFA